MLALVLALSTLAAPLTAADEFAAALLGEIQALRAAHGLAPLADDPALAAVAAARTAAMARDGWFGFTSPEGVSIEAALDAAGVPFRLVTEKLVRTAAAAKPLADEWRLRPDAQRNSLLHPQVRAVGVGVAEANGERLVEVVLIEPAGATAAAAPTPVDVEGERQALRARLDARRAELGRGGLRSDAVLDAAAQQHAEAYLAALAAGRGPETIATLEDRVVDLDRRHRGANVTAAASKDLFMSRELSAQTGDRRPVGDSELFSVVIGDARDAETALETIEAERSQPYCLDGDMRVVGVGLAAGPTPAGERIVWVVVASRRR